MSVYCSRCEAWVEADWLPDHTILKCRSCLHSVPRSDRLASELIRCREGLKAFGPQLEIARAAITLKECGYGDVPYEPS